jgi:hypothetical protein
MDDLVGELGSLTLERVSLPEDAIADSEELRSQAKAVLEKLRGEAKLPEVEKQIKDRLMDFLTFNAYSLPMYARPGLW